MSKNAKLLRTKVHYYQANNVPKLVFRPRLEADTLVGWEEDTPSL